MSYCESLQNKLPMCPCSKESDVPKNQENEPVDNDENVDQIEDNFDDVLSSDGGSDEEADSLEAQGYISLAQSEDDVGDNEIEQAELETCTASTGDEIPAEHEKSEEQRINPAESSSSAFSSTRNTQMGEDEINLIKSVMTNIQLPSSAIPEWAKKIPEDKWKQPLVSALQQKTNRNNESVGDKHNAPTSSKTTE